MKGLPTDDDVDDRIKGSCCCCAAITVPSIATKPRRKRICNRANVIHSLQEMRLSSSSRQLHWRHQGQQQHQQQHKAQHRYENGRKSYFHTRCFPHRVLQLQGMKLLLLLLLSSRMQFQSRSPMVANAQSIQGYVYWDANGNGLMEPSSSSSSSTSSSSASGSAYQRKRMRQHQHQDQTPTNDLLPTTTRGLRGLQDGEDVFANIIDLDNTPSQEKESELVNGMIDVKMEVYSCDIPDLKILSVGDGSAGAAATSNGEGIEGEKAGGGSDIKFGGIPVYRSDITDWPDTFPNEKRIEDHSPIYTHGGYYKIDLDGAFGCIINDDNLKALEKRDDEEAEAGKKKGGCFLVATAPWNYEITSSYPMYATISNKTVKNDKDPFHWDPFFDNQDGSIAAAAESGSSSDAVNRGYHARTRECFGFHSDERKWYVWNPNPVESSSSSSSSKEGGGAPQTVMTPNAYVYDYDEYLAPQVSYDPTLSIAPIGMVESIWPLPLRTRGHVMMGLEFDDTHSSGDFVTMKGNGKVPRFEFTPQMLSDVVSSSSLMSSLSSERLENGGNDSASTSNEYYRHDNDKGLLPDASNMEEELRFFIWERIKESGEAWDIDLLDVDVVNQWSLVNVVDKASRGRRLSWESDERPLLRGSLKEVSTEPVYTNANYRHLRGNMSSLRMMKSLSEPHVVMELELYGKYRPRNPAGADEASALQASLSFPSVLTATMNRNRESLVARMRQRSGYGQECNLSTKPEVFSDEDGIAYTPIGLGTEKAEEEYVEIDIGVVNRYDCNKLLPLYYYEVNAVFARSVSNIGVPLSKALELFKADDGYYGGVQTIHAVEGDGGGGSATPAWIIIVTVIVLVLVIGVGGMAYFVRKERRRVIEEKRIRKEERMTKREARKKEKELAGLNEDSFQSLECSLEFSENSTINTKKSKGKREKKKKKKKQQQGDLVDIDEANDGDDESEGEKKKREKEMNEESFQSLAVSESGRIRKTKRKKKQKKTEKDKSMDADGVDESEVEKGGGELEKLRETASTSKFEKSDSDSDNSELDRLFTSTPTKDVPSKPDSEAKKRRRSRKCSSKSSKSREASTSSRPEESANSTTVGYTTPSHPHSAGNESDDDPPERIDMRRESLEKGISDVTFSLVASMRKSSKRVLNQLKGLDDEPPPDTDGSNGQVEKKGAKVKRKKGKKAKSSPHANRGDEEGVKTSHNRSAMMKRMSSIRASITKFAVRDLESSSSDDDSSTSGRGKKAVTLKKKMGKAKAPTHAVEGISESEEGNKNVGPRLSVKRKAMMNAMTSFRASLTKLAVADLASSSSDDSSSSSSSSSNSSLDSDSSSSSSSSSDNGKRKRPPIHKAGFAKGRRPSGQTNIHRKASTGSTPTRRANKGEQKDFEASYGSKSSGKGNRKEFESSYGSKTSGKNSRDFESSYGSKSSKTCGKSNRSDKDRNQPRVPYAFNESRMTRRNSLDTKASEQTKTNEYLPYGLDVQPHQLEPSKTAQKRPSLTSARSKSSKGSKKSKSSKSLEATSASDSDCNGGSLRSLRTTGSTKSKISDTHNQSAQSLRDDGRKSKRSAKKTKTNRGSSSKDRKKEKDEEKTRNRKKTRPSLSQVKSSLTSSVSSSLKGKKLSKLAESALEGTEDLVADSSIKPLKSRSSKSSKKRTDSDQPAVSSEHKSSRRSSKRAQSSRATGKDP